MTSHQAEIALAVEAHAGEKEMGQERSLEVLANATPSGTRDGFIARRTPGPWHVLGGGRIDAPDGMVASVLNHPGASPNRDVYTQKANAALIVKAVNAHDDLLAELINTDDALTKLITDLENIVVAKSLAILVAWQDSVRATISKATGGTL